MGNTITVTNAQRNNLHVPHEVLLGLYHFIKLRSSLSWETLKTTVMPKTL